MNLLQHFYVVLLTRSIGLHYPCKGLSYECIKVIFTTLSFQWSQTSVWSNPSLDDISETSSINNLSDKQDVRKKNSGFYIGTSEASSSEFMKLYIHSSLGESNRR